MITNRQRKLTPLPIALAFLCALLWSGQGIAAKFAVLEWPPFRIVCFRHLMALPFVFVWVIARKEKLKIDARGFGYCLANALFICCSMVLFVYGTGGTTTSRSMLLVNTFPIFAAIFCSILLPDSRITVYQSFCILIVFSGVALMLAKPEQQIWLYELVVLVSAAVVGLKIALVRYVLLKIQPAVLVFWTTLMTGILCGLLSLGLESAGELSMRGLLAIAYQGVFVSAVGSVIWTSLLGRHNPHLLTPFQLLAPVISVLLGVWLLNEPFQLRMILATILVLTGIGLVILERPRTARVSDGLVE